MDRYWVMLITLYSLLTLTSPASGTELPELTLEQALSIALASDPELASYSWELRAREGRLAQAGTFPNPEIEFSAENFWGDKDLRGFDGAEYTLAITQLIELGGKRSKRQRVAGKDLALSKWDYEGRKLDLLHEVTKAFVDLIAAQERFNVTDELFRLAEQSLQTVSARVQAGKVSPIDEIKASVELSKSKIELEHAKRSLDAARRHLSISLGSPEPFFKKAVGKLALDADIPSSGACAEKVHNSPYIARWSEEIEQRKAALNLERANRIPDPSVSIGVRRLEDTESTAMVAGISLPLPLFNQNSGAIAEADSRLAKAEEERRAAILKLQIAVTEAHQALSTAFIEAKALKESILPELQAAFDAVQEGYRYGKFSYIDLLDAQRSLSESRKHFIESLAAYRKAYSEIERITGAAVKAFHTDTGK